jgi:cell shape-determining protein MreD
MFFRALAYIVLGWLLLAAVAGLGHVFELSIMLPSTTAVLLVHLAFSREGELPAKLAIATVLGYLEDLHQGGPLGTLILAHQLSFLALYWASGRLALHGWLSRAAAAMAAVGIVDLATWGTLMVLADPMRIPRDALMVSLWQARWHLLATFLVAHPVWRLVTWLLRRLRLEQSPTPEPEVAAR